MRIQIFRRIVWLTKIILIFVASGASTLGGLERSEASGGVRRAPPEAEDLSNPPSENLRSGMITRTLGAPRVLVIIPDHIIYLPTSNVLDGLSVKSL
ncbi:uncharacterized protein GO595_002311 [Histomonas meleagridis]|uniref:uncharacterized protein n=1 Tax=Histomonas meleagridis TaxID=135588 RepID=UPI00355977C2|nr:hypothetical protein GO595_002311 [Histomonas meleagridis]